MLGWGADVSVWETRQADGDPRPSDGEGEQQTDRQRHGSDAIHGADAAEPRAVAAPGAGDGDGWA